MREKWSISLLAGMLLCGCSPKVYQPIDWQAKAVIADGKIDEWANPLRYYDDNSKVNYAISNDRENFYLCMKVINPQAKVRIMRGGVTLKIDTTGGKKYPIAFTYPFVDEGMPPQPGMMPGTPPEGKAGQGKRDTLSGRPHQGKPDMDAPSAMQNRFAGGASDKASLEGFKRNVESVVMIRNNNHGIKAAMVVDKQGTLFYEAIIPFKTFFKEHLTEADSKHPVSIQLLFTSADMPGGGGERGPGVEGGPQGGGPGDGGGFQGEGGSMSGGGMGGGGMRGGRQGGFQGGPPRGGSSSSKSALKIEHRDVTFSYK